MSVFLSVSSVALCFAFLTATIYVARSAALERASLQARLRVVESRIELLERSVTDWSQATTDIAQSIKMTRVRKAAKLDSSDQATTMPDPHKDPEAWRKAMNLDLARRRLAGVTHN